VNDLAAEVGIDAKYGITQNLTADFTVNTDFAQVEADEQQVNLTRFSLFFPEKRDFFLENAGLFAFGGTPGFNPNRNDMPLLFYSRRIGLNAGRVIPIDAGSRLTGRLGRYSLGVMDIRTGEEDVSGTQPTNFSAARVKRDVFGRSSIGLIATGRSVTQRGTGSNVAYGVDGAFGFFTNLTIDTYWARTSTTGRSGNDTSYRTQVDYNGRTFGAQAERLVIGEDFNPEVGFVRRPDIRKNFAQLRYSPWPTSLRRPAFLVRRIDRLPRERQQARRDTRARRRSLRRFPERGSTLGELRAHLRVPARSVSHRLRGRRAGRRLHLPVRGRLVSGGAAAPAERADLVRPR
jgi:hypothetical protein